MYDMTWKERGHAPVVGAGNGELYAGLNGHETGILRDQHSDEEEDHWEDVLECPRTEVAHEVQHAFVDHGP